MSEIEYIWHGRRYWVQEPTGKETIGWNTRFEPCFVLKKTAKRITIESPTFGVMQLNREAFERDGKVYHSKVHEYFYAKPFIEKPVVRSPKVDLALTTLGLHPPVNKSIVKRAYKQMAIACHPDTGGTNDAFVQLNNAYQILMEAM